jgi:hypothetical protein
MANTKVTGDLIASGTITAANLVSGTLDGILGTYLSTNSYATESYVTTAVSNLIDAAPASLDTLNELAAALNDDANFATTVTDSIATKLPLAGGNITGNLSVDTNVLFVDTNLNRVGVGTSGPTHLMQLYADSLPELRLGDATTQIQMFTNTDAFFGTVGAHNLIFRTAATEHMRITSGGNVGIGTTSPTNRLQVQPALISFDLNGLSNGAIALTNNSNGSISPTIGGKSTTSGQPGLQFITGTNDTNTGADMSFSVRESDNTDFLTLTSSAYKFSRYTTSLLEILRNGNVGIGTTSPEAKLHLLDNSSANVLAKIRIQGDATSGYGDIGMQSGYIRLFSNGSMCSAWTGGVQYSYINGSTATTLNSTGFGIGTTSPEAKLDVNGDVFINSNYTGSNAAANDLTIGKITTGDHGITIATGSTYTGSIYFGDSDNNDAGIIGYQHSNNSMKFTTNRSEKMRITSAGNVGIGTSSPSVKLQVIENVSGWTTWIENQGTGAGNSGLIVTAGEDNGDNTLLLRKQNGTETFAVKGDGNVGIGTSNPRTKTHISGLTSNDNPSLGSSTAPLFVSNTANSYGLNVGVNNGGDSWLQAQSNTSATAYDLLLNPLGGNVGIGESSIETKLHISDSVNPPVLRLDYDKEIATWTPEETITELQSFIGDSSGIGKRVVTNIKAINEGSGSTTAAALAFFTSANNSNVTERMRIDSSGNVSIASGILELAAQAKIIGSSDNLKISADPNNVSGGSTIEFLVDGSEKMRIDSSGTLLLNGGGVTVSTSVENGTAQFKTLNANTAPPSEQFYVGNNLGDVDLGNKRGALKFFTGTTERMRINSSGNVGIGTSSITDSRVQIKGGSNVTTAYYDGLKVTSNNETVFTQYNWNGINGNSTLLFATGGSERMRITSGGEVLLAGLTDNTPNGEPATGQLVSYSDGSKYAILVAANSTSGRSMIAFSNPNGIVGEIVSSGSSTAYNTSSDYRLKENVVPMEGALDRVDALKPSRFNFIADADKTVDGFIAHEVQAIVPEAVTGEKDAVDADGNPIYQGIDQSKLVPLLVGAIQELKNIVDQQQIEIETLKAQING